MEGVRFEYLEGEGACGSFLEAYMDLCEFETFISEIECLLADMVDELKSMIDHRDVLLGGLTVSFPEMYKEETFVGFYGSLCEAKKDYDLRTMSQGSSTSVDYKEIQDKKGKCVRIEANVKFAYFAVRSEVEKLIADEEIGIRNKIGLIKEKKKFLEKLKRIQEGIM
jgi:hypothetical protein